MSQIEFINCGLKASIVKSWNDRNHIYIDTREIRAPDIIEYDKTIE